jgi:uncharacterized membrane protein YbaN (DUF454 family)
MRLAIPPVAAPHEPNDIADVRPAREPRVVHSSFGRLRVHLPRWSGLHDATLAAAAGRLPGVTRAEANPITGNLLILFDPKQTSGRTLLEALPGLIIEAPSPSDELAAANELGALHDAEPGNYYMTGTARVVYQALGWASVGMAVVGAIVPGIPTAPFVLLAGYFFVRSSREAHQWLRQSRWFGPILRDWEEHRGVRRSIRNAAVGLIVFSMALTMMLGVPTALLATILTLQLVGLAIVLSLRVVEPVPAVE